MDAQHTVQSADVAMVPNVNERSYVCMYSPVTAEVREVTYQGHSHFDLLADGWKLAEPLTKRSLSDAQWHTELHYHGPNSRGFMNKMCHVEVGPRGGETYHIIRARISGQMQTWKSPARKHEFRQPAKYGMKLSVQITHENAHYWHLSTDCPRTAIRCPR
jgi:hypothetical protein